MELSHHLMNCRFGDLGISDELICLGGGNKVVGLADFVFHWKITIICLRLVWSHSVNCSRNRPSNSSIIPDPPWNPPRSIQRSTKHRIGVMPSLLITSGSFWTRYNAAWKPQPNHLTQLCQKLDSPKWESILEASRRLFSIFDSSVFAADRDDTFTFVI